jgi:hypothetical protein
MLDLGIIDLREQLPVARWRIGQQRRKTTVTAHYNGPEVGQQGRAREAWVTHLRWIADYHMHTTNAWKTWNSDGICYHFAITPDGDVFQLRDLDAELWHCGHEQGNEYSLAVHFPLGGNQQPTGAAWAAFEALADALVDEYKMGGRAAVLGHSDWGTSTCPGPHIRRRLADYRSEPPTEWYRPARPYRVIRTTKVQQAPDGSKDVALVLPAGEMVQIGALVRGRYRAWVATGAGFVDLADLEPIDAPAPRPFVPRPISVHTAIIGEPRGDAGRMLDVICSRDTGEYTRRDLERFIIPTYFQVCAAVGVDPLIALAQTCHETAHFTSWWAARPRRNPAGLGVDRGPSVVPYPGNVPAAFDGAMWRAGLSFPTWCKHAIPAHVGRLVAYAVPPEQYTEAQRALVDYALSCRPLSDDLRGAAPTLADLVGRWASDAQYAEKLVTWAQRLRGEA